MDPEYIMNAASILFIVCYIPELQANQKNKNANLWNVPEKAILLVGTGLAFTQAVLQKNEALLLNQGPILALDTIAFMMRAQYAYRNQHPQNVHHDLENQPTHPPDESV